jgi:hypothetical protein
MSVAAYPPLAHLGSAGLPWAINGVKHPAGDAFAVLGVGTQAIALANEFEGALQVVGVVDITMSLRHS